MNYALYNEIDPFAADWLERLTAAGHIGPGIIERRSITELTATDVAGPGQRHFFAGIGGWSYALRLAGIDDDSNVWTGSCPCQPFSGAGKRGGTSDPRHLWPAWFALIEKCRPAVIFGEQVASSDGLAWLDLVYADLERCGYSVGASDLCAAGVGAPHIRQRLYFVAYADSVGGRLHLRPRRSQQADAEARRRSEADRMGNATRARRSRSKREVVLAQGRHGSADASAARGMGDASGDRVVEHTRELPSNEGEHGERAANGDHASVFAGAVGGFWRDADWLFCTDGFWRPVEPGTFPLAHGAPVRVGRLRGYGNAINVEQAAAFIEAAIAAHEEISR